jgi:hypothetical protein
VTGRRLTVPLAERLLHWGRAIAAGVQPLDDERRDQGDRRDQCGYQYQW